MDKLVTRKEVLSVVKVHYHTLMAMVKRGEIETVSMGNKRLYNLDKYLRSNGVDVVNKKRKICYSRILNKKQGEDMKKQNELFNKLYPNHEKISDIGSGLNNKRKGYLKIMDMAIQGEIDELVITHKDRLSNFGYDQLEYIIKKYSNGKIIVLNEEVEKTKIDEVTEDLTTILNLYVAKVNGLKEHKNKFIKNLKNIDKQLKVNP
jgi:putative resolvase